jgi:hypothetical protein
MATFADLRAAMVTVLGGALSDVTVYANVPDRANLPAIVVEPADATFPFTSGRAEDEWQFDLVVMVPYGDAGIAQDRLDVYLSGDGATSIRQIFMQNKNLGRTDVLAAYVAGMSNYGASFTMAGVENIGCKLRVIVATTGPAWG